MLTSRQIREFSQRGYVCIEGVAGPALIDSVNREVDRLIAEKPPPNGHTGFHFYWPRVRDEDALLEPLIKTKAFILAQSLVAPGLLEIPGQAQVALNIPPYSHRPGGPHLDGTSPPEPSGRPGTFTMLAGILLTDQPSEDMGNLWVWPGTHMTNAAYFREHGAGALMESKGYPAIELPTPRQVLGKAGDLFLAHYLLGHNMGGNNSSQVRRALYFRLFRKGHRARWQECLPDPWLEFDAVRATL